MSWSWNQRLKQQHWSEHNVFCHPEEISTVTFVNYAFWCLPFGTFFTSSIFMFKTIDSSGTREVLRNWLVAGIRQFSAWLELINDLFTGNVKKKKGSFYNHICNHYQVSLIKTFSSLLADTYWKKIQNVLFLVSMNEVRRNKEMWEAVPKKTVFSKTLWDICNLLRLRGNKSKTFCR